MKRKIIIPVLIVIISMLLFGCSARILDFTIVSTKNIDVSQFDKYERGKSRVSGKDVGHYILYVPISPNMKNAIDNAIESTPGCVALLDGVVYEKAWWAILYGQIVYVVEGTPLIDPKMTSYTGNCEIDDYTVLTFDRKGEVKEVKSISPEKYDKIKKSISKLNEKRNNS